MAMIITALTGTPVTPLETATYGSSNGTFDPVKRESHWSVAPTLAANSNLKAESLRTNVSVETVNAGLRAGGLVIMGGRGGSPFTETGHYIVVRGVTETGKWKIADPYSDQGDRGSTNTQEWDPAVILSAVQGYEGSVYVITK
jgi:hypothetical protein